MGTDSYTKENVTSALRGALTLGAAAGNARVKELAALPDPKGKMLEACGGSTLTLAVDGRTRLGGILSTIEDRAISIRKGDGATFYVHLRYEFTYIPPVNGQE